MKVEMNGIETDEKSKKERKIRNRCMRRLGVKT